MGVAASGAHYLSIDKQIIFICCREQGTFTGYHEGK